MHTSQIAFWAMGAFLLGVAINSFFAISPYIFGLFCVALVVAIAFAHRSRNYLAFAVMCGFFIFGVARVDMGEVSFVLFDPVRHKLEMVRDAFVVGIDNALPEPQAAFLSGILVGVKAEIPYDIKDAFRRTGTSHITALSGYNLTIISEQLRVFSQALWVPFLGIALFILGTGASSSVVRAGIMGSLVLVAKYYGRDYHVSNSLMAAAFLMVLADPSVLLEDIGFQLSVLATAGLIYLVPKIDRHLFWIPKAFGVREAAAATLSAQIMTLPLILYYFGTFSLLSPVTNVLVLIVMPFTMSFGFVGGLAGLLGSTAGSIIAWPAYLLLTYQIKVITFFAGLNF